MTQESQLSCTIGYTCYYQTSALLQGHVKTLKTRDCSDPTPL